MASKTVATQVLRGAVPVPVIDGFFQLAYATNTGAAFSMMDKHPSLLLLLTALLFVFLVWMARSFCWESHCVNAGAALAFGGAIGNFCDRLRFGFVVDFLDFYFGHWHYPTFNLADTGICVGLGLILLHEWKRDRTM